MDKDIFNRFIEAGKEFAKRLKPAVPLMAVGAIFGAVVSGTVPGILGGVFAGGLVHFYFKNHDPS